MATATRKPRDSKPRDTGTAADSGAADTGRTGLSRAVIWAGLALGTAVTVLAVMNGIRIPRLEVVLSVLATWALLAALAVTGLEMLRRHHRAIGRHGWRYGKPGAIATARGAAVVARGAAVRSRPWRARIIAAAEARWAARSAPAPAPEQDGGTLGWAVPALCDLCGLPLPAGHAGIAHPKCIDIRETAGAGTRERAGAGDRFFALRRSGYTGPIDQDGHPVHTEGNTMTVSGTGSRIKTQHRAQRAAARSGGTVPAEWGPVIAAAADFEPENDGELLEWMSRQVTGLSGWAEALVDFYEHCTAVIGIDPQASAMLHDVADAAAQAAETMGAAKAKFTEHYELPREFAGNGGLMTHDGRWVTGEGT